MGWTIGAAGKLMARDRRWRACNEATPLDEPTPGGPWIWHKHAR